MSPESEARFWAKVNKGPDCWMWTRHVSSRYGQVTIDKRRYQAHRVAYELLVGPIPRGLVIDHLCRNPLCCNPEHLEPVTQRENIARGNSRAGEAIRRARSANAA